MCTWLSVLEVSEPESDSDWEIRNNIGKILAAAGGI